MVPNVEGEAKAISLAMVIISATERGFNPKVNAQGLLFVSWS
jgi:hypothetical protein